MPCHEHDRAGNLPGLNGGQDRLIDMLQLRGLQADRLRIGRSDPLRAASAGKACPPAVVLIPASNR